MTLDLNTFFIPFCRVIKQCQPVYLQHSIRDFLDTTRVIYFLTWVLLFSVD